MIRLAAMRPNRQRVLRGTIAVALGAGVLAVMFGAGNRAASTYFTDDGAYVQSDDTVAHVNAASGTADARAARAMATGKQPLEVVQVSSGAVYVVNNATGDVYLLPTDTLEPQQVDKRTAAPADLRVATGGGRTFLLDPGAGRVTLMSTEDGGDVRADVPVPAPVDQLVVDGSGIAWAYSSRTGDLYRIDGGQVRDSRHVSESHDQVSLTLAGGSPVVYDAATGTATGYGDGEVPVNLAAAGGVVAAPGTDPTVAVVAVPSTAEVVAGDLHSGEVQRHRITGREGHTFGPPVVVGGRVYLPDYTAHEVVVLDLGTLAVRAQIPVPGTSRTFVVVARDGRVWVNDPFANTLVTIGADGQPSTVDKTTGEAGPSSTAKPPAPTGKPPAPSGRPSASPRPGSSGSAAARTRVTVPDVVGRDRAAACAALSAVRLGCKPVAVAVAAGTGPAGAVLSTDPAAGTAGLAGDVVTVYYRGQGAVSVPDLVGQPADQACAALQNLRLVCARQPGGVADLPAQVGVVTGQQPAAGAAVPLGASVTVTYPDQARPQTATVPDVVGMDPATACATLQAAGLVCVQDGTEATAQANVVHGQSVAAGAVVAIGTPVKLLYGGVAPVALLRYKAPGAKRANFLTVGDYPAPAGWNGQPAFGAVYAPGQTGVQNLVPIYRFCYAACGNPETYYYSANPAVPAGYVLQGEAFRGLSTGGRELHAMFNGQVWVWAVPGTGEYSTFQAAGFKDQFVVCHIW